MKQFIQQLVKDNLGQIADASFFNYGVKGLHMIEIFSEENKGLRLFITDANHGLQPSLPQFHQTGITYPFQYYGQNFTVHCIKGYVSIWTVKEADTNIAVLANEYEYDGEKYHRAREHIGLSTESVVNLQSGQSHPLPGNTLYNFGTRFGSVNAWFVYEGKTVDAPYSYYTNIDDFQTPGMFQKPSPREVVMMLDGVGLI